MRKSVSLNVDAGLWSRVGKMAANLSITVPELVEHCVVRRLRKLEKKHAKRINLENTKPNAKPKAKKKVTVKKKKATPKKVKRVTPKRKATPKPTPPAPTVAAA